MLFADIILTYYVCQTILLFNNSTYICPVFNQRYYCDSDFCNLNFNEDNVLCIEEYSKHLTKNDHKATYFSIK